MKKFKAMPIKCPNLTGDPMDDTVYLLLGTGLTIAFIGSGILLWIAEKNSRYGRHVGVAKHNI